MATEKETEQNAQSQEDAPQVKPTAAGENTSSTKHTEEASDAEQPLNMMTMKDDLGTMPFNVAKQEDESGESAESSRYFWIQKPAEEAVNKDVIENTVVTETEKVIGSSKEPEEGSASDQSSATAEPVAEN